LATTCTCTRSETLIIYAAYIIVLFGLC
jgi:hypothetical protein